MDVPAIKYRDLIEKTEQEETAEIRKPISSARNNQSKRFARKNIHCNSQMRNRHIKKFCIIDDSSSKMMEKAIHNFGLSAIVYHRILKIARTIAELASQESI